MRFESGEWLMAMWAAGAVGVLALWGVLRRRSSVERFVEPSLAPVVAPGAGGAGPLVRAALCAAALLLSVVALARPQWGRAEEPARARGRDICFIIDVSRSMLAEDLAPNRLERAKLWVQDVLTAAKGDRVAVIAFAGEAVVKCPLTLDYGFARLALQDTTPESVSRGGTLIGDAIRLALSEVFEPGEGSFKDIILITDGEDHDSFPVEAARVAGESGVRIIALGVGDDVSGRPIRVRDPETGAESLVKHNGEIVLTRLDGRLLREVAAASRDGVYFHVSTGTIELDSVYKRLIRQSEQKEMEETRRVMLQERFQVFVAGALGALVLSRLVSERRSASAARGERGGAA